MTNRNTHSANNLDWLSIEQTLIQLGNAIVVVHLFLCVLKMDREGAHYSLFSLIKAQPMLDFVQRILVQRIMI